MTRIKNLKSLCYIDHNVCGLVRIVYTLFAHICIWCGQKFTSTYICVCVCVYIIILSEGSDQTANTKKVRPHNKLTIL